MDKELVELTQELNEKTEKMKAAGDVYLKTKLEYDEAIRRYEAAFKQWHMRNLGPICLNPALPCLECSEFDTCKIKEAGNSYLLNSPF